MLNSFPQFMKNEKNRVGAASQHTPDIEGYFYDGADGGQMAFWTCDADRTSEKHTHDYDEYIAVVAGRYTLWMNGEETPLAPGDEAVVPAGKRHGCHRIAGTRTIHAFGGRRCEGAAK